MNQIVIVFCLVVVTLQMCYLLQGYYSVLAMGFSCCVPGCRVGYKERIGKSKKASESVPLYKFPKDEKLRTQWISAIPRKNWTVTASHRICKNHFTEDDFLKLSCDTNSARRISRDSQALS